MAELLSKTALGGAINDTFEGMVITRVIADGVYVFNKDSFVDDQVVEIQEVADEAARLAETDLEVGDMRKQTDTGAIWQLTALPAATATNWALTTADTSDIFKQLSEWTLDNAEVVVAGNSIGVPSAILNDNDGATFANYRLVNNLPLATPQTVRLKFVKTAGNLNAIILQATDITTNTSSVAIDSITGATTTVVAGTGVAPTIVSTTVTDGAIEVVATFPANTDYTTWVLYPSTVTNAAPTTADITLTGTQEILELDLNYTVIRGGGSATVLDAGAGAVAETLPAATEGDVVDYLIQDNSNTITIQPQAGETIYSITNHILDVTKYVIGTQLRFTARADGQWVWTSIGDNGDVLRNSIQNYWSYIGGEFPKVGDFYGYKYGVILEDADNVSRINYDFFGTNHTGTNDPHNKTVRILIQRDSVQANTVAIGASGGTSEGLVVIRRDGNTPSYTLHTAGTGLDPVVHHFQTSGDVIELIATFPYYNGINRFRITPAFSTNALPATQDDTLVGTVEVVEIDLDYPEPQVSGLVSNKVDSSGGATTETLDASTNAGVVKLYTNIDVTNTATLAVQAGETLNGVTDATFLFSNYSVGTQFRADEVTGGWVVSVVGASTQIALHQAHIRATVVQVIDGVATAYDGALLVSTGDPVISSFDVADIDQGGMVDLVNNKIIIQKNGNYDITGTASMDDGTAIGRLAVQIVKNGTDVIADAISYASGISDDQIITTASLPFVSLVAGDEIQLYRQRTSEPGSLNSEVTNLNSTFLSVKEIASTETVLAGMVTPTPLTRIQAGLSANQTLVLNGDVAFDTIAFNGGIAMAAGVFSLKANKTYRLKANLRLGNIISQGPQFAWVNATTNAELLTNAGRSDAAPSSQSNSVDGNSTAEVLYTPSADMTVKLRYIAVGAGGRVEQYSTAVIEELPTSTVVNPDTVPVEDLHYANWRGFDAEQAAGSLVLNGLTPNAANYEYDPQGLLAANGTDIVIQQEGVYKFDFGVYSRGYNTALTLYIDGVAAAATSANGATTTTYAGGTSNSYTTNLTAGQIVTVRGQNGTSGLGTNTQTSSSYLSLQQLPTSTVVNPEGLVPEDLDKANLTNNPNGAIPWNIATTVGAGYFVPDLDDLQLVTHIDTNGLVDYVNNKFVIQRDGDYRLYFSYRPLSGSAGYTIRVDGAIVYESVGATAETGGGEVIVSLTAGQEVEFASAASIADVRSVSLTVEQLPTSTIQYVNPAFTEAKDLDVAYGTFLSGTTTFGYAANTPIDLGDAGWNFTDTNSLIDVANDKIVIKNPGNYHAWWALSGRNWNTGTDDYVQVLVDGVVVGAAAVWEQDASNTYNFMRVDWYGVLTAGQEITFQTTDTPAGSGTRPQFAVVQLPSTEYVTPGDVPVVDQRVLLGSATGITNGQQVTISQTWGSLEAEYEYVEFHIFNSNEASRNSIKVSTKSWDDNTNVRFQGDGTTRADLNNMDISGTTADFIETATAYDTADIEVYGIKAQKTVINTTDIPVDNTGVVDGETLVWDAIAGEYKPGQLTASLTSGMHTGIVNNSITNSAAFGDIPGSSFTLPSAGTYMVTYDVQGTITGLPGPWGNIRMTTSANVFAAGSQSELIANSDQNEIQSVSKTVLVTTTGSAVYKLQYATQGGSFTIYNNSNLNGGGNSTITWIKVN